MPQPKLSPDQVQALIVSAASSGGPLTLCAYGHTGAGKTRLAATAPKCLLLDVNERGTRSIRDSEARVFFVQRWTDINAVYWYLQRAQHDFESVAIDTVTALQALCLSHVLGIEAEHDPTRDRAMPDRRVYGKVGELMKVTLLAYRNLPLNVIFTAQERSVESDDGSEPEREPDLSPMVRGVALGAVNIVGRIYRREVTVNNRSSWETRLLVGHHDRFRTKDRTGSLPRVLRNPTIPEILKLGG